LNFFHLKSEEVSKDLRQLPQIHWYHPRYARFNHGDSIHEIRAGYDALAVLLKLALSGFFSCLIFPILFYA
jgi:hypothetical protein